MREKIRGVSAVSVHTPRRLQWIVSTVNQTICNKKIEKKKKETERKVIIELMTSPIQMLSTMNSLMANISIQFFRPPVRPIRLLEKNYLVLVVGTVGDLDE